MELRNQIKTTIIISTLTILVFVIILEIFKDRTYYTCLDLSELDSYIIEEQDTEQINLVDLIKSSPKALHKRTYYTSNAIVSKIPFNSQKVNKGVIITNGLIDYCRIHAISQDQETLYRIPFSPNGLYEIPSDLRIRYLLIEFRSKTNISTSIIINELSKSKRWIQNKILFLGFYTGIILISCIINWILYKIVVRLFFKYYILYLISVYAAQGVFSGLFKAVLYPNSFWLNSIDFFIILPLSYIGCIAFISQFIPMYDRNVRLKSLIRYSGSMVVLGGIIGVFITDPLIPVIMELHILLGVIFVFIAIFRSKKRYFYEGQHLFFSWSFFLLGIAFFIISDIGIIKTTVFASMAMTIGSGLEVISMTVFICHVLVERDSAKRMFRSKHSLVNQEIQNLKASNASYKAKIKKTKNQLLITQMDPHFIFNALNSINSSVMKKDFEQARNYLMAFSRFMRSLLYVREQDFIKLEEEIRILEGYVSLEENRIGKKVVFEFHYSDRLDIDNTFIPSMIIQPIIENSLWHGFTKLEGREPVLTIDFYEKPNKTLEVVVTDNGIGRAAAEAAKANNEGLEKKKSFGLGIVNERLAILSEEQGLPFKEIKFDDVVDENGQIVGTEVTIIVPIKTQYDLVVDKASEDPDFAEEAKEYLQKHLDKD